MDKALKKEIMETVSIAMQEVMEGSRERWVTGDELGAKYGFFTKSWLRYYGHTLPRTRVIVTDSDGKEHQTVYCYPEHKIGRMIQDGSIKQLKNG